MVGEGGAGVGAGVAGVGGGAVMVGEGGEGVGVGGASDSVVQVARVGAGGTLVVAAVVESAVL